jgi:hypothetical protein
VKRASRWRPLGAGGIVAVSLSASRSRGGPGRDGRGGDTLRVADHSPGGDMGLPGTPSGRRTGGAGPAAPLGTRRAATADALVPWAVLRVKGRRIDYVSSQGCRFRCGFAPTQRLKGLDGPQASGSEEIGEPAPSEWRLPSRTRPSSPRLPGRSHLRHLLRRGLRPWTATMRAVGVPPERGAPGQARRAARVMVGVGRASTLDWMKDMRVGR